MLTSKLATFALLLRDSLGGNSKTVLVMRADQDATTCTKSESFYDPFSVLSWYLDYRNSTTGGNVTQSLFELAVSDSNAVVVNDRHGKPD